MSLLANKAFVAQLEGEMDRFEREKDSRRFNAEAIAAKIKSRVIGQDQLADSIANFIARRGARRKKESTLANILISGPTGTGKTETAKAISEAVFGSADFMLEIACGTLGPSEHALASVIGAPKMWQGASRGAIADYLTKTNGEGVILFDEYEKAAPNGDAPLGKALLNLMDKARFQTPYDMSVCEATGCIIVLTSNLKPRELADASKQIKDPEDLETACRRILSDAMAPEFLGRIDLVATTLPLDLKDRARIVTLQIERLAKQYDVEIVSANPGFFSFLRMGTERFGEAGARGVIQWLGRVADDAFSEAINEHRCNRVIADSDGKRLILIPAPAQTGWPRD